MIRSAFRSTLFVITAAGIAAVPAVLHAQDYKRVAPKLPPLSPLTSLDSPAEFLVDGSSQAPLAPQLNGLVFVPGPEHLVAAGWPASAVGSSGVNVAEIPVLNDSHFVATLAPYLGKPLLLSDLARIRTATADWLRAHQRPFTDVSFPPQNIANGVVQVVVTEYKLGQVNIEGARHFSDSLIESTSGLVSGQTLRLNRLQSDLDRLNRNPFLNVDAVFSPGDKTGETDVTLKAHDQLPLRAYASYDNLGVRSLGISEYNVGVNWGNAFGKGQILSYQFTQTLSQRSTSHSISDAIPLRWGDQLLIFGSYGLQRPFLAEIFNDEGHSGQASVRYVHSLPRMRHLTQSVQLGYDFKTTDSNLEFAGIHVFDIQAEVDQFPLGYDATISDRFGQTAIQNTFVFSPGRLTPNNTTAALSTLVPGAAATYFYDRFLVTRNTPLPRGLNSVTRVTVQASNRNLPYSEQVGGGGVGSVRGYFTDTAFGSLGELFSQELRLPAFNLTHVFNHESDFTDKTQFGGFFDFANLHQVTPIPDVKSPVKLASAGLLARYSMARSIDLQFDLGWRLLRAPTVPERGAYAQISLTGSF